MPARRRLTAEERAARLARVAAQAQALRASKGLEPVCAENDEWAALRAQVPRTSAATSRRNARLELLRKAGLTSTHRDVWPEEPEDG